MKKLFKKRQLKRQQKKQRKAIKELICSIATAIGFGVTVAILNKDLIQEKISKISVKNNTTKKA